MNWKNWVMVVAMASVSGTASAKEEDWYWGFELGAGGVAPASTLEAAVDALGGTSTALGGSLHFYWPEGKTLWGVASASASSSVGVNGSLNMGILSLSWLHSFGPENGLGFILRGDVGLGTTSLQQSRSLFSLSGINAGLGLAGSVGYGIAASDETRLLFTLRYGYITGGSGGGFWTLTFGPLF